VFSKPQPLLLTSGVLLALAAFPGLPMVPFLVLSGGVGYAGWRLREKAAAAESPAITPTPQTAKDGIDSLLRIEPLAVEVGLGLVKLVEGGASSPLLKRIAGIRRQLATDLGYILPPVRVTDNLSLRAREYVISLKGVEISRYEMPQGCELAIQTGKTPMNIQGISTREPAFGIPAVWVSVDGIEKARSAGYTVVDAISVLGTHLGEIIRSHSHELFSRQDAKRVLDRVAEENPRLVEDLVPKLLSLAAMQKVLQNLLRERVSIRDASSILEALGEAAAVTKNTVLLTEYVRQTIRRMVVKPYLNAKGDLPAYFLDGNTERIIEAAVEHTENMSHLNLSPQKIREILEMVQKTVGTPDTAVVVLASSGSRYFLRQIAENSIRNLFVLAHSEVPAGVRVISLGTIQ